MGTVTADPPTGYIYLQSNLCGDFDKARTQTEFQTTEKFLAHLLDLHIKHDETTTAVRVSQHLACRFTALQTSFDGSDELMTYLLTLFSRTSKDCDSTQGLHNRPSRKKSRKSQPKRNVKHSSSTFHESEVDVQSPGQSRDEPDCDTTAENIREDATAGAHHIAEAFSVPTVKPENGEVGSDHHLPLLKTVKQEKDADPADPEGPLCLRLHQPRSTNETHMAPAVHRPTRDRCYPTSDTIVSMRDEIHSAAGANFGTPPRHALPQWRSSSEPLSNIHHSSGSQFSPQKPHSLQVSPQTRGCDGLLPTESPRSRVNSEYQEMDIENNNVNRPYPILGKILDRNQVNQEKDNNSRKHSDSSDGYNYVLNCLASPKKEDVTPCSLSSSSTLQVPLQYPVKSPYSRPVTPVGTEEPEDLSIKTPDKDNIERPENLTVPKLHKAVLNYTAPATVNQLTSPPVNQLAPPPINQLTPIPVNQLHVAPTPISQSFLINSQHNIAKYDKNGNALLSPVFQFPNGFPIMPGVLQTAANSSTQSSISNKETLIGQPSVAAIPPKFRPIAQKGTVSGTSQVSFVRNAQGTHHQSIVLAAPPHSNNIVVNVPNGSLLSKPVIVPEGTRPQNTATFQHVPQPILVSNMPNLSPIHPPSQVHILSPQNAPTVVNELSLVNESSWQEESLYQKRKRKRMDDTSVFRDPPESSLPFNGPHKFRFYCDVCDTGFTRRYTFNRHKCKGRVEKHYCQLCDKAYLSKYKLKDHVLVKHEGQTVSCPDCGKRFSSRSSMEMHKKQQHEGQFSIFCKICGKGFNHTGHYYGHMNKHTNTRPFWCQQCGKRFYGSSYLHNHKQVCRSDTEFNYACNQCDRRFKCELYLKKHQKVHEVMPLIYQAKAGMQIESDGEDPDADIMQIGNDGTGKEDGELIINESDDDDALIIDSSKASPRSTDAPLLERAPQFHNDPVFNEEHESPDLTSMAHIGQETITAS